MTWGSPLPRAIAYHHMYYVILFIKFNLTCKPGSLYWLGKCIINISCKTNSMYKMAWPSKVESYLKVNMCLKQNSEQLNPTIFFKFQENISALMYIDCNSIILGKTTILILSYRVFYSAV